MDSSDAAALVSCLSGPDVPADQNCTTQDLNGDDRMDLLDYAQFQRCFNGDGAGDLGFNCTVFDNDEDIDVDLTDFEYFQPRLTGP